MNNEFDNIPINEVENEDIRQLLGCANEFKQRDEMQRQSRIPTKEYEEISGSSISILEQKETKNKKKNNLNLTIWLISISILFLFAIFVLINVDKFVSNTRDLNKSGSVYVEDKAKEITIENTIISYDKKSNDIEITINNNGDYIVLYDIRGTYLSSSKEHFYTVIDNDTNLSHKFFGAPIQKGENISGSVFYSSSTLKKTNYLILTNVIINDHSYDIVFEL